MTMYIYSPIINHEHFDLSDFDHDVVAGSLSISEIPDLLGFSQTTLYTEKTKTH